MTLSMYTASVPVYIRMLNNLIGIMEKAAAHCEARKIDPMILTQARFYPDMFHFARQARVAADVARTGTARLMGMEVEEWPGVEESFPELIERVRKTIAWLEAVTPEQVDGSEEREIPIKRGDKVVTFKGLDLLRFRTLPNFYFHVTTAYDILRHNGLEIGKADFLGR